MKQNMWKIALKRQPEDVSDIDQNPASNTSTLRTRCSFVAWYIPGDTSKISPLSRTQPKTFHWEWAVHPKDIIMQHNENHNKCTWLSIKRMHFECNWKCKWIDLYTVISNARCNYRSGAALHSGIQCSLFCVAPPQGSHILHPDLMALFVGSP